MISSALLLMLSNCCRSCGFQKRSCSLQGRTSTSRICGNAGFRFRTAWAAMVSKPSAPPDLKRVTPLSASSAISRCNRTFIHAVSSGGSFLCPVKQHPFSKGRMLADEVAILFFPLLCFIKTGKLKKLVSVLGAEYPCFSGEFLKKPLKFKGSIGL